MATVTTSVTDFSSTFGTLASTWTVVLEVLDNLGPELAFALTTLVLGSLFSHLKERSKATKGGSAATFAKSLCCKVPSAASAARPQCRSAAPLDKKKRQPLALQQFVDEVISTRMPAAKALTDYEEMRKIGLHMRIEKDLIGSSHSAVDFFRALVQCAGRSGRPALVELILDDMADAGVELPENIYESAMRLLSGKSCFKEALRVYKRMLQQNLEPSLTTMSCVIGFSAELGDFEEAATTFDQLCNRGVPSVRACMSILRVYTKKTEWAASRQLLYKVQQLGGEVDTVMLNTVLSTGVNANEVNDAEELLSSELALPIADVVSYNIILKGFAQSCELDRAIKLLHMMRKRGVDPNLISFNTALDATVRARRSSDTWCLYDLMVIELRMQPDKCTCSTLVKSFSVNRSETVERVVKMLDLIEKLPGCSEKLYQSLLSGCLNAALRLRKVSLAMKAFAKLCEWKMVVTATELRILVVLAAAEGDAAACRTIWSYASKLGELGSTKAAVDKLMHQGRSVVDATRLVTSSSASPPNQGDSRDYNSARRAPWAKQ